MRSPRGLTLVGIPCLVAICFSIATVWADGGPPVLHCQDPKTFCTSAGCTAQEGAKCADGLTTFEYSTVDGPPVSICGSGTVNDCPNPREQVT